MLVSRSQFTRLSFHDHSSSVPIPGIATILQQLVDVGDRDVV